MIKEHCNGNITFMMEMVADYIDLVELIYIIYETNSTTWEHTLDKKGKYILSKSFKYLLHMLRLKKITWLLYSNRVIMWDKPQVPI